MPEPELHVRDLTPPLLGVLCDTGQHLNHLGQTCEEYTQLQDQFVAFVTQGLLHGAAEAERRLVEGDGTGAPLGFLRTEPDREPTPGERAFAILEPHLTDVPLYRPRFARGGILPRNVGATAGSPLCQPDCRWPVVG